MARPFKSPLGLLQILIADLGAEHNALVECLTMPLAQLKSPQGIPQKFPYPPLLCPIPSRFPRAQTSLTYALQCASAGDILGF